MEDSIHATFAEALVLPELAREQVDPHVSLRPQTFDEYPGQERIVENLKVYTKAAKLRGKILDHCLFHGPPGLGKTTLAGIIASTMGAPLRVTSGPVIERPADLMGILANIDAGTILFIDEIHRLPAHVEEILYSAMEDMRLDVLVGQGPTARTVKLDLPPFCLIGATTRAGSIAAPLRDRFGIQEHLDYYSTESLTKIIVRSASIMNVPLSLDAAQILAKRCRGTPRIANQLLRRVSDFALVADCAEVSPSLVNSALGKLGVDEEGLTKMDRDILTVLAERYKGGPVGLEAIAAALNEERGTLEDVYEPYLVHQGFLLRTPRGRQLSERGIKHLQPTVQ